MTEYVYRVRRNRVLFAPDNSVWARQGQFVRPPAEGPLRDHFDMRSRRVCDQLVFDGQAVVDNPELPPVKMLTREIPAAGTTTKRRRRRA